MILGKLIAGPVWGRDGSFRKFLAINPHIKDPDKIFPGDKIFLGEPVEKIVENSTTRSRVYDQVPAPGLHSETNAPEPRVYMERDPAQAAAASPIEEESEASRSAERVPKTLTPSAIARLSATVPYGYSRLQGVEKEDGARATLLSDVISGLTLTWQQKWSETLETYLLAEMLSVKMLSSQNHSLQDPRQLYARFGFGVYRKMGSLPLYFGAQAASSQEPVFQSVAAGVLRLDRIWLTSLGAGMRYFFFHTDIARFGVEMSASSLLPSRLLDGAHSSWGRSMSAKLLLGQDFEKFSLLGNLYYLTKSYDTAIVTQSAAELGVSVGVAFDMKSISSRP